MKYRPALPAALLLALCAWPAGAAETAAWQPINCPPKDGPLERMFEPVSQGDPFDAAGQWSVHTGDQTALATLSSVPGRDPQKGKALRIAYEFVGKPKLEYVAISTKFPIEKPGHHLAMWAKVSETGGSLRFRVKDASGETHQGDFLTVADGQWHYTAMEIRPNSGAWGGDGNRKLDYPLTLESIIFDRPSVGYKGKGEVFVDELTLVRRAAPLAEMVSVSAPADRPGLIFNPGEKVAFRLQRAKGIADDVQVTYRLRDYWGSEIQQGKLTVGAEGTELSLRAPGRGYFVAEVDTARGAVSGQPIEIRFAVMDPALDLHKVKASPFAMQAHFRNVGSWRLDCMPLFARASMKYLRDEMSWSAAEREKGVFQFEKRWDEYVDQAVALGIEPLIILDYGNPNYDDGNFPTSDEAVAGFARYAYEVASRYRGKVRFFEVWNEWSGGCGMKGKTGNTPENYVRLLKATTAAVRKANPEAYIIGIGGEHSAHHIKQIEAMFAAGALQHMDAVSVHPYRYPRTPEASDLAGELMEIKRLITKYGGKQNLWITEIGWPTHLGSRSSSEEHQARMIVRSYLGMVATGAVERIFWYDFKDDGLDRFYNENNFGIIRHEKFAYAPKPAYVTFSVMSRLLSSAQFVREEKVGAGALAYRFRRPDGSAVVVAWAPTGEAEVAAPWKAARITDIMGNTRPLTGSRLKLTGDPVYIEVPK